ncbi:MAG: zinc ribbon domain-containing protein [Candidatus Bathyarchaeia archaeon]
MSTLTFTSVITDPLSRVLQAPGITLTPTDILLITLIPIFAVIALIIIFLVNRKRAKPIPVMIQHPPAAAMPAPAQLATPPPLPPNACPFCGKPLPPAKIFCPYCNSKVR